MEKLHIFKPNEIRNYKFTTEQYINLEMEYNRYIMYKNMIKNIENTLKNNNKYDNKYDNKYENNKKNYENKNIIDRFILECINYGISPFINNKISNLSISGIGEIDSIDFTGDNMELLKHNIFFNTCLESPENLYSKIFYNKMTSEYNEKNIKLSPLKHIELENIILETHKNFQLKNKFISKNAFNTTLYKTGYFNNITCSLNLVNNNTFIIQYRDYIKVINYSRYSRLIKNYNRPFPYDLILMVLRYALFDCSTQQWSIGNNLYDNLSQMLDISFEMFASPLNFNMPMYCSIFEDTDKMFGSIGSFYNLTVSKLLNQNIKGVIYNPPYLPILMANTNKICINMLSQMDSLNEDFTIISFLPYWIDADYIKNFIENKYVIKYKKVNKGDYVLQEKDKGKIIKGTFDLLVVLLNTKKNLSREYDLHITFNKIITIMMNDNNEL